MYTTLPKNRLLIDIPKHPMNICKYPSTFLTRFNEGNNNHSYKC